METSILPCTRLMESMKKERDIVDPAHITHSVKHSGGSVITRACMAVSGTGSPLYIVDMTGDGCSRMSSITFSVQGNTLCSDLAECCKSDRMTLHNAHESRPKAYWKQLESFSMERCGIFFNSQVRQLILTHSCLVYSYWRQNCRQKDWLWHLMGGNSAFADIHGSQTSGCLCLQRIFRQVLKTILVPIIMQVGPITVEPLKKGGHSVKTNVIPKRLMEYFSRSLWIKLFALQLHIDCFISNPWRCTKTKLQKKY